ncbi:MAG: RagB/SusD family nutrient uptake outer membrane protein [Chitinophagaceae bacterium]
MKRIVQLIFLASSVVWLGACSKTLSTLPDNRAVITTPDQVTQLLTSAYPHATYMAFTEPMSDNAEDKGSASSTADPESYTINLQAYQFQDATSIKYDSPIAYWDSCYKAIAVANQALLYCNGADSAKYSAQKGEALVCRAYAHFMLVTLFAKPYDPTTAASDLGVPYVTKVQDNVFQTYTRGTVASVYANIESDLVRGLSLIQDKTYGTVPKFHFTLQAAHAFASRFYMFKQDYAQAITHSTAVFGTSDPSLLIRNQVNNYANLQYSQLTYAYTQSSDPGNILLQEAISSYFDNYASYRFGYGEGVRSNFFSAPNVTGGSYGIITYGATPQYYNFPKWYPYYVGDPTFNVRYGYAPLFSMEEILMNRAEAYVRTGNQNAAISDLNAWVSKNVKSYDPATHNITTAKATSFYQLATDASLIECALDFKRITYMQEGLRWFDLIRLKRPVYRYNGSDFSTVVTTIPATDKRRILQLPAEATQYGLQLNPR